MAYLVVIEKSADGYAGYVPDLPGCVVFGDTAVEVKRLMREAIDFHLEGLAEDNEPAPPSLAISEYVTPSNKPGEEAATA